MLDSTPQSGEKLLWEARSRASILDWTSASNLSALAIKKLDPSSGPGVSAFLFEFSARCHFKWAFSSIVREQFENRMRQAEEFYTKAASLYMEAGSLGLSRKSSSRSLFASFWLHSDVDKMRDIIRKCIELLREASEILEKEDASKSLGETRSDFLNYLMENLSLATESTELIERFNEARTAWQRIVTDEFGETPGNELLLESLTQAIRIIGVFGPVTLEPQERAAVLKEADALVLKLSKVADEIGTAHALSLASEGKGNIMFNLKENFSEALTFYDMACSGAQNSLDSLELGRLYSELGAVEAWLGTSEDDYGKRRERFQRAIQFATDGIKNLQICFNPGYLTLTYATLAKCHIELAAFVDIEFDSKKSHLTEAIEASQKGLSLAKGTTAWQLAASTLSKALYDSAILLSDPQEKKRLLMEAMQIRVETLRVIQELFPHFQWNRGVSYSYLALLNVELADLEQSNDAKVDLVNESLSHMRKCLDLCRRSARSPGFIKKLATYYERYGDVLLRHYTLTKDNDSAERASEAYHDAIKALEESDHYGPIPTCRWKIAKAQDTLGRFGEAAKTFAMAAEDYALVARRVTGLASAFEEFAMYMKAWSLIEEARDSHTQGEFISAFESYTKAAQILNNTRAWNHVAGLCTARSILERAESLSHEEKHVASREAFGTALRSFFETKGELEKRAATSSGPSEGLELKASIEAATQSELYCKGRIELEEAREHDRNGEKAHSARKYRSASETFSSLVASLNNPEDRRELETLAHFCDAWARMKEAESESSPDLYSDAAESFLRVSDIATKGFRLLALANSSICRALEAGTRFRYTRDAQLYSTVKRHLEAAADYYSEAGFKKTERWTRATQRFFDALEYMSDAEAEKEPRKRSELYQLAEKHLELAARLYGKAGFPRKKEEAMGKLERAREEKELLLSAMRSIAEIPTATGSSVISPAISRVETMGLERFEDANIVGNLSVPVREAKVGSDFIFEIELANVGKGTATLVRLENAVPEGFEIERQKNSYRIEDHSIDMRGKRLEHLKMEELKLVLTPVRKGMVELRPSVFFTDEKGNQRRSELGPVPLTIAELGISGWLRGPTTNTVGQAETTPKLPLSDKQPNVTLPQTAPTIKLHEDIRFENYRASAVFQELVKEFLRDYMSRRLYVEVAGWRSLMALIHTTKIPRSALYGPEGRDGPVLTELEHRGLIETRIFPKERGRGGEIKKVRVAYGNAVVKTIVERAAMQNL